MTAASSVDWHRANQRFLMARLEVVREALTQHRRQSFASAQNSGEQSERRAEEVRQILLEATRALPTRSALDALCEAFRLSPFERDLLLLCAGVELDSAFAELCATAQGDPQRAYPTFSLALAALGEPHWSAITPTAPLRRWRLIELGVGETVTGSPLRIDERVLHHLTGISCLDSRLQGLVEPLANPAELPGSHHELARRLVRLWTQSEPPQHCSLINLCGEHHQGKEAVIAFACGEMGLQSYLLRGADVPQSPAEREGLSRLWEREAALGGCALVVDASDSDHSHAIRSFLENVRGMIVVLSREPFSLPRRPVIRLNIIAPSSAEQRERWQQALGERLSRLDGRLDAVISQFTLSAEAIDAASAAALSAIDGNVPGPSGESPEVEAEISNGEKDCANCDVSEPSSIFESLWDACRTQARARLDDLAQRIEPAACWDDLVLPDLQRQILRDIAVHVRQRARIYEEWGFASKGSRGLGLSALFAGPSGTGKTMAAEVLANELRLDLYRIDLSQVVNKYIGETEKNLRRVFEAAESGGAILLFDEADALFGKRTEVKDSHDRYANIEISYLLQRMETYRGLAILTTNMKSVLDSAFLRRIRFVVQFPFPDAAQRAEIWRRIFPAQTPVGKLDINKLARLNVAGGNIRNIALQAAFLAADSCEPVRMFHLLRAARSEYAKLEKPLTEAEVSNWA
ncbi:MAG TPA: ATP-binding protein [Blastocatellia bacterium]|nr:ATP-binding protein [Blastocatellia bacterium]